MNTPPLLLLLFEDAEHDTEQHNLLFTRRLKMDRGCLIAHSCRQSDNYCNAPRKLDGHSKLNDKVIMDIAEKMLGFMAIIFLGCLARRSGLVKPQAIGLLSAIVLNLTLPCTIIRGLNGVILDPAYFALLSIGFLLNFLYLFLGRLSAGNSPALRGFSMINIAGYNIGMFAMAFIQSFFDSNVFMVICLCDVGNAIMTMGGNYAFAARAAHSPGMDLRAMLHIVLRCVGFHCYVVLIALSVLHISLPENFMQGVRAISLINPFLCMFMIGLGLNLSVKRSDLGLVVRILALRYGSSALLCLAVLLLPLERGVAAALCLFLLSPVSGLGPVYTFKLNPEQLEKSSLNSCLSILVSTLIFLFLIPALLRYSF